MCSLFLNFCRIFWDTLELESDFNGILTFRCEHFRCNDSFLPHFYDNFYHFFFMIFIIFSQFSEFLYCFRCFLFNLQYFQTFIIQFNIFSNEFKDVSHHFLLFFLKFDGRFRH